MKTEVIDIVPRNNKFYRMLFKDWEKKPKRYLLYAEMGWDDDVKQIALYERADFNEVSYMDSVWIVDGVGGFLSPYYF